MQSRLFRISCIFAFVLCLAQQAGAWQQPPAQASAKTDSSKSETSVTIGAPGTPTAGAAVAPATSNDGTIKVSVN